MSDIRGSGAIAAGVINPRRQPPPHLLNNLGATPKSKDTQVECLRLTAGHLQSGSDPDLAISPVVCLTISDKSQAFAGNYAVACLCVAAVVYPAQPIPRQRDVPSSACTEVPQTTLDNWEQRGY